MIRDITLEDFGKFFDHTLLKSEATKKEIEKLIYEALKYNFNAIFINSYWIGYAKKILEGSKVKLGVPIGFPLGADLTRIKVLECKIAIEEGAEEIDMVMNIGAFKDKEYNLVLDEINEVVQSCSGRTCKVIIETGFLSKEEIIKASKIVLESNASFIKTSTGLFGSIAKVEDVRLIREVVGKELKIKASGGIRSLRDTFRFLEAGADRIGCSKSVQIMEEFIKERRRK